MVCSQCLGNEKFFNEKHARKDLKHYLRRGPAAATGKLLDAIRTHDIRDLTLLDIGGGIGAIQLELLKVGVKRSTDIDASSAYIEIARQEAQRQNLVERISYLLGDFVELEDQVKPADIVTLDRVICCYPDMEKLVTLSTAKAGRLYGLIYPRTNLIMKFARLFINLFNYLRRNTMRFYLHDPVQVDRIMRAGGLTLCHESQTPLWLVRLYQRTA